MNFTDANDIEYGTINNIVCNLEQLSTFETNIEVLFK